MGLSLPPVGPLRTGAAVRFLTAWRLLLSISLRPPDKSSTIGVNRMMTLVHSLHARIRCAWRTRGLHELDVHSGRCRHCKQLWSTLYPGDTRRLPKANRHSVQKNAPGDPPDHQRGDKALASS